MTDYVHGLPVRWIEEDDPPTDGSLIIAVVPRPISMWAHTWIGTEARAENTILAYAEQMTLEFLLEEYLPLVLAGGACQ